MYIYIYMPGYISIGINIRGIVGAYLGSFAVYVGACDCLGLGDEAGKV